MKLADYDETSGTIVPYTPEKALALILDCGLFKDSYQHICLGIIEAGCKLYPPYNAVREAKGQSKPKIRDSLSVTDYSASVNLQILLDHTAKDWLLQKSNIKVYIVPLNWFSWRNRSTYLQVVI